MRFAELDAVTVDAFQTLMVLEDPAPALRAALAERGVERSDEQVVAALQAESAYYDEHADDGRDEETLAALRTACARVFLEAVGAELDPTEFAPTFIDSLRFQPVEGAVAAVSSLRERGLELAVVANWDISLPQRVAELGLEHLFAGVFPLAQKPDPSRLLEALERLDVHPSRALHIGDDEVDEQAARAAEMHFLPAPLAEAVEALS